MDNFNLIKVLERNIQSQKAGDQEPTDVGENLIFINKSVRYNIFDRLYIIPNRIALHLWCNFTHKQNLFL